MNHGRFARTLLLSSLLLTVSAANAELKNDAAVPGEYLVKLKRGTQFSAFNASNTTGFEQVRLV